MKGTYRDLMSVDEFFQALFQDREFFREHGITHLRSASLYFTPCDSAGKAVAVRDQLGREVDGYQTAGCYHSAADGYTDAGGVAPRTVRLTTTASGVAKRSGGGKGDTRPCKPG
jgi:hypothetical protein